MGSLFKQIVKDMLRWAADCRDPGVDMDGRRAEAQSADAPTLVDPATDMPGVDPADKRALYSRVPVMGTLEDRTLMTLRCRDLDSLRRVEDAGAVVQGEHGTAVQIMHNGIRVVAGGYYGEWMQDLIARCRGHHEPQEERVFDEVMRHIPNDGSMIELGGYWSYYSIWFLSQSENRKCIVVEADPSHLVIGKKNAEINGCAPIFIQAYVGSEELPPMPFKTEDSGIVELSCVTVHGVMQRSNIENLDLLHCDIQGAETVVLSSCMEMLRSGRVNWVFVSTHSHHISGDPLTHQKCVLILKEAGATIVVEHDVQESFSGDGLIVAKFGELPAGWITPPISYNRYSSSLFRNPLYDLAAACGA